MSAEEKKEEVDSEKEENTSIKEITVAPALTALLKPTAEYLGLELRDYVKSHVEEWKEKRRTQNLKAHLQAVRKQIENDPHPKNGQNPSFSQLTLFDEWIDRAQDIDPEDKELSKLWQSLLARAARGDRVSSEVMSALKTLSPREAKFLFEMKHREHLVPFRLRIFSGKDRYLVKSLEAKRILERDHTFLILLLPLLTLPLLIVYFFYYYFKEEILQIMGFTPIIPLVISLAVILIPLFVRVVGMARWRLTWLGCELMNIAPKSEMSVTD